jgi:hypothetical protein
MTRIRPNGPTSYDRIGPAPEGTLLGPEMFVLCVSCNHHRLFHHKGRCLHRPATITLGPPPPHRPCTCPAFEEPT